MIKKTFVLLALSILPGAFAGGRVWAASTDIVPRGSATLDAFATLAREGAFGASDTPEDFLGEPLYTRGQLARLLEHLVTDEPKKLAAVQADGQANTALHAALTDLQGELARDGVDTSEAEATPVSSASLSGYVQPEVRVRTGGDHQPNSAGFGVYRLTALGNLQPNLRYVLSASNWPEDRRRVFDNDKGSHDFSAVNEAYLELDGGRGLTVNLGRMYDRWGPGYRGATMLSDNAPALDQIQIAFPFSLGARFGHDYRFTQMASTFQENGTRKYFAARRIEYAFSPRLNFDFQESYKSSRSRALIVGLLPDFYTGQSANLKISGLRVTGLDQDYNAFLNAGLSYAATPDLRVYGQLGVDDIQSPGHQSYRTPRKIAQLAGVAFRPLPGTDVIGEYTFADPTTYTSRIFATQWQKGLYDNLGLPSGPNSREVFVRLSQRLMPGLTVALQDRDRRRKNDSFPEPNARDLAASLDYALNARNGLEVTFHDYRQTAFPLAPGVPVSGDGFTPANAEGNYGQNLSIKQLDFSYRLFF